MCLGAIYWARPARIIYACTREVAAAIEFDDDFIYKEINLPADRRKIPAQQWGREKGLEVFRLWKNRSDKVKYISDPSDAGEYCYFFLLLPSKIL